MSNDREADRRRHDSIYEREEMVPERLLHDLANTPIVDESTIPDTKEPYRHEGQLTTAEHEIVSYLSHGWTLRMIAEQRATAYNTIRDQVKSARTAVGAKNTTHLIAIALRHGLID